MVAIQFAQQEPSSTLQNLKREKLSAKYGELKTYTKYFMRLFLLWDMLFDRSEKKLRAILNTVILLNIKKLNKRTLNGFALVRILNT